MSTILTHAAFLALASNPSCNVGIPPAVLAGLNRVESGYNIIALNVNTNGKGQTIRDISSITEAKEKVRELIRDGRNFDAGIMQINYVNWKSLGLTIDNIFQPCANIAAAAKLLRSYSLYNTGSPTRGLTNGYAGRAWTAVSAVSRETPATGSGPVGGYGPGSASGCPLPRPPAWAGWAHIDYAARCRMIQHSRNAPSIPAG